MRLLTVLLPLTTFTGACVSPRVPSPEPSRPAIPVPTADTVAAATDSFSWSGGRFRVQIEAQTVQADSAAVDSLKREALVQFTASSDGQFVLLEFDTISDSITRLDTAQTRVTRLVLDSAGHARLTDPESAPCAPRAPEVSPLLVRQLVFPANPQAFAQGKYLTDSLAYNTCIQGVRVQSLIELRWTIARTSSAGSHLDIQIAGQVHADSTRELPMRFSGRIRGTSSAVFSGRTFQLVQFRSLVQSDLETIAGTNRQQRFTQTVTYQVAPDTTHR